MKKYNAEKLNDTKVILFDLDGTLVDSSEGITKSAQYALKHYGIDKEANELLFFVGPPLMHTFTTRFGFSEEKAREAVKVYRERYQDKGIFECCLYDGVEETIKALKEKGYKIGLASSKPEESCKIILDHFGILELFDEVVGATFDGKIDTKEQVLNELMRRWSEYSKDEMCLIGDTMFDVNGANQVGMKSVVVSFGFGVIDEMVEAGALAVFDSMKELLEVF